MAPHNKNNSPSQDFKQAEMMINQSIAKMENETHIEYNSSINREDKKPSRFRLCRKLRRLIGINPLETG